MNQSACRWRWREAASSFILAGLCALSNGLCAQAPPSVSLFDISGQSLSGGSPAAVIRVSGSVLDAETGQPLPAFQLTEGRQDRKYGGFFDWAPRGPQTYWGGRFALTLTKERAAPAVLIEADGYLPQSSGPIYLPETNFTFLLKKGTGPEGVVLTPDGRPAAGRTVYLSLMRDLIFIEGPSLEARSRGPIRTPGARTDQAGRFSFAPDIDASAVLVVDETGFAEVNVEDLKASPQVRLQPWARVEGVLRIGAKPGANEPVRLSSAFAPSAYYPRPLPPCWLSVETTTDGAGRFVFPRVPPADIKVFHAPRVERGDTNLTAVTQVTNVCLKPGETRQVTLGGQGRPVIGRAVLKGSHKTFDWRDQVRWMDLVVPDPPDLPALDSLHQEYRAAMRAARTDEERAAAQERFDQGRDHISRQAQAFYSSAEGRQLWFSNRRYAVNFSQDGSFRVEDVPGGKYQLAIDVRDLVPQRGQLNSPVISVRQLVIQVPGSPGGRSDTPYDIGTVELLARLNPGDMAPEFTVKTLAGKTIKLSNYRGKYVLLDFWAASDRSSEEETPGLKETCAAFKNDPRLAMIGLSLDTTADAASEYIRKNQIAWPQGVLGARSQCALPDEYGVERLPFILLVGPDGRVLVTGLRGGAIQSTVDAALNIRD